MLKRLQCPFTVQWIKYRKKLVIMTVVWLQQALTLGPLLNPAITIYNWLKALDKKILRILKRV